MKKLIIPIMASTMAVAAAAATAQTPAAPNSFETLAHVFNAADMDRNGALSAREYLLLRTGTVDDSRIGDYRGDEYGRMVPTVVRSFAQLDRMGSSRTASS